MPNKFHKAMVDDDIHVVPARVFADIAARDADTAFHSNIVNVNKMVRVNTPLSYFLLVDNVPTWENIGASLATSFLGLTDTPNSYAGEASRIAQVNTGETGLEFGRKISSPNIKDIFGASDWGTPILAPDGVMRVPLIASTSYLIYADHILPRLLMPDVSGGGGTIDFRFVNNAVTLLFLGDSTPHIWGRNVGSLAMFTGNFVDISGGGFNTVLFDLQGFTFTTRLSAKTMFIGFFKSLGHTVDVFHDHADNSFGFNEKGFVVRTTPAVAIGSIVSSNSFLDNPFVGPPGGMKRPFYSFIGPADTLNFNLSLVDLIAGDDFLYFDESFTATTNNLNNLYAGSANGNFYQTSKQVAITGQTGADITIDSFETRDGGAKTAMVFSAIQDFIVGQIILIADEAAYNGFQTITAVDADQMKFVFDVAFSTSGAGTLKMVRHAVAVGTNPYVRDTTIAVTNTANYNDPSIQILREDDDSFHLPQALNGTETGTAVTSPLNEKDVTINARGNGAQKDSKEIALGFVNDQVDATTIASNAYLPIDTTGFLSNNVVTERFVLTNSDEGLFTYIGLKRFQGFLSGDLAALKAGATQNYRFAMSLNGGIPLFTAIGSTAISSVTLGSLGRASFNHAGTSPPIGSFVTLSGFITNTKYNVVGQLVKASTATSFEIDGVLFETDEATGTFTAQAAAYVPMEVKTTKVVIPVLFSAILDTGETIQLMVAGQGTIDSLTVTDLGFGVF